jgi:hypothetical protein
VTGSSEVALLRSRLDATFGRIAQVPEDDLELRSDFAQYLCIRVSGYLERAIVELLNQHTFARSPSTVTSYVNRRLLAGFQNPSKDKILRTLGDFDSDWRAEMEAYIVDERASAVSSINTQRNRIAHGDWSDITYVRVKEYYGPIDEVVRRIEQLVA